MSIAGKVALVTGASRGLGAAIAEELAVRGARVAVGYHQAADRAEAVCRTITEAGGQALAIGGDVAEETAVRQMFETIRQELGPIEILVNNAGILRDGPAMLLKPEQWDRVLAVNLRGAFLCCRQAIRHMIGAKWGRIVSLTSPSGLIGRAGQVNYAASKAGLLGLTRSLARELARFGITVNAVAPGVVETEMLGGLNQATRDELLTQIPLGRFGRPDEIARAVAFLIDGSEYVTGQILSIDGGLVMG